MDNKGNIELADISCISESEEEQLSTKFSEWLNSELNQRRWSNSELARLAGVVPSTISQYISGHKTPSADTCVKIARVLGYSTDHVLRQADLLPEVSSQVQNEEDLVHIFRRLDAEAQEVVLAMMRGLKDKK